MELMESKLGDYIELCDNRNHDLKYGVDDVRGVNNLKSFISTKADLHGRDLSKFQIVYPGDFVFNHRTSRNGSKFSIAYNDSDKPVICTEDYVVFRICDGCKHLLNARWLYMYFNRSEFDRYVITNSWGSSTEFYNWEDVKNIRLKIPSYKIQLKFADIYEAILKNQICYEYGLEDLKLVCDSYIEELRRCTPCEPIGKYSFIVDDRNSSGMIKNVKGLTVYKKFIETKADMTGVSLTNYKIVRVDDIAYVPTTNRNGNRIACGLCKEECIVSSIYEVMRTDKLHLLPEYLFMWFKRAEFDRWVRYNSWGSARETIEWADISNYLIPIPDITVQRSIVNIFECYQSRYDINESLKAQLRSICPILVRGSYEEVEKKGA